MFLASPNVAGLNKTGIRRVTLLPELARVKPAPNTVQRLLTRVPVLLPAVMLPVTSADPVSLIKWTLFAAGKKTI